MLYKSWCWHSTIQHTNTQLTPRTGILYGLCNVPLHFIESNLMLRTDILSVSHWWVIAQQYTCPFFVQNGQLAYGLPHRIYIQWTGSLKATPWPQLIYSAGSILSEYLVHWAGFNIPSSERKGLLLMLLFYTRLPTTGPSSWALPRYSNEEKTGFLLFPQAPLPVVLRLDASQISSMSMGSPHNRGSHFCQKA